MRSDARTATPGGPALIPSEWLNELSDRSADDHMDSVSVRGATTGPAPHNQSTSSFGSVSASASHMGPSRQNSALSQAADGGGYNQTTAASASVSSPATLEVGPILDSSGCPAALQMHLAARAPPPSVSGHQLVGVGAARGAAAMQGALVGVVQHEHTVNGSVRLSAICMTEVNFRYMKHVLLRFILGKESEVLPRIYSTWTV